MSEQTVSEVNIAAEAGVKTQEEVDAINNETDGLTLFLKSRLNIANMESPAPTLSIGFILKAGQENLFSFWSPFRAINYL